MKRIVSLDYARGFTVCIMPAVHSVLLYSQPGIQNSVLDKCLALLAEGPGAQLLMTLMGIGITLQKESTAKKIAARAAILLLLGYALNAAKFIVPFVLQGLPLAFLNDLTIRPDRSGILNLLLIGDILHFAAIALPLTYLVYRSKNYPFIAGLSIIVIMVGSPFAWNLHLSNQFFDYLLQLLAGGPPRVFFPVFPWLVYPLLGVIIGYGIRKHVLNLFSSFRAIGAIIICIGVIIKHFDQPSATFYQTRPGDTLLHIGIVLIALYAWHWVSFHIKNNVLLRGLQYCSKNITLIYCIQWLVVCWGMSCAGYEQLDMLQSILAMVLTSLLTFFITYSITTLYGYYRIYL